MYMVYIACSAYGAFTLESILAAAFGRVVNVQRGEADEVAKAAKGVFDSGKNRTVMFCLLLLSKSSDKRHRGIKLIFNLRD